MSGRGALPAGAIHVAKARARAWLARRRGGAVAKADGDWDEDSHPRGEGGKFGSGGGESKRAESARFASEEAHVMSAATVGASPARAARAHRDAASAHKDAASEHEAAAAEPRSEASRDAHLATAREHLATAAEHAKTYTRPDGKEFWKLTSNGGPPVPHEWPAPKHDAELELTEKISTTFSSPKPGDIWDIRARGALVDAAMASPVTHWVLENHPPANVSFLKFPEAVSHTSACYDPNNAHIEMNFDSVGSRGARPPFEMGKSYTVSTDRKSGGEYAASCFTHELGHHLMEIPGNDKIARQAFESRSRLGVGGAVSEYARTNHEEYFAESFSAYTRDAKAFGEYDRIGFHMIEESLAKLERR